MPPELLGLGTVLSLVTGSNDLFLDRNMKYVSLIFRRLDLSLASLEEAASFNCHQLLFFCRSRGVYLKYLTVTTEKSTTHNFYPPPPPPGCSNPASLSLSPDGGGNAAATALVKAEREILASVRNVS
jgi:hypothetical protein